MLELAWVDPRGRAHGLRNHSRQGPPCKIRCTITLWILQGGVLAGKECAWSPRLASFLRDDATGAGRFAVGWVPPPDDNPNATLIYLGLGSHLVTLDVALFQAVLEDGCLSTNQLIALSRFRPDTIPAVVRKFPLSLNTRDPATGDTVLHYCARQPAEPDQLESESLLGAWLQVGDVGVAGTTPVFYKPIANFERGVTSEHSRVHAKGESIGRFGQTALHCAIAAHKEGAISTLCGELTSQLLPIDAVLMADDLAFLALTLPELVSAVLQQVEAKIMQRQELSMADLDPTQPAGIAGVRVSLGRREARGSISFLAAHDVPSDVISQRQHVWAGFVSSDSAAREQAVVCYSVGLAGLLGDHTTEVQKNSKGVQDSLDLAATCANNRLFHILIENCDQRIMLSPVMQLATQLKWEQSVRPLQLKIMCANLAALVIATVASLSIRHQLDEGMTTVLSIAMIICETVTVIVEVRQSAKRGLRRYLRSFVNLADSCGSLSLISVAVLHFAEISPDWQGTCAGFGLLVKWGGVMDYLRLFPQTASHVRMVSR